MALDRPNGAPATKRKRGKRQKRTRSNWSSMHKLPAKIENDTLQLTISFFMLSNRVTDAEQLPPEVLSYELLLQQRLAQQQQVQEQLPDEEKSQEQMETSEEYIDAQPIAQRPMLEQLTAQEVNEDQTKALVEFEHHYQPTSTEEVNEEGQLLTEELNRGQTKPLAESEHCQDERLGLVVRLRLPLQSQKNSFKCDQCDMEFPRHQALGGHKTKHRKPAVTPNNAGTSSSTAAGSTSGKLHRCHKCEITFPTGQALGGHMSHCDRSVRAGNSRVIRPEIMGLQLDLNLPSLPEMELGNEGWSRVLGKRKERTEAIADEKVMQNLEPERKKEKNNEEATDEKLIHFL